MTVRAELERLDDSALVTRAKEGDPDAWRALYRRYVKEVFGYLMNQLGHREAAEDVTSETFLRAVRSLEQFDGRSTFRTWIYVVARNQLRDRWRRQERRPSPIALDDAEPLVAPDPSAVQDNPAATKIGREILEALPDNYRRVLELRIMDGRSIRDSAEEMDTTPGNVKVMQHRALKRARQIARERSLLDAHPDGERHETV